MKQTIRFVVLAAMLALTLPALAQAQGTGATGDCTDDNKAKFYTQYYENRKDHQDIAYTAAKQYLAACPNADDTDKYAKVLKKFIADYDREILRAQFLAAYDKKNYTEMMTLGKQVLAADPNYIRAYILLGNIGYLASVSGNTSLNAESTGYAKKAIELLEGGKTPDDWKPYTGKDDALAWLNYSIGQTLKTSPSEALPFLLKAVRYEGLFKHNPLAYISIEQAYENGPYAKQSEDYKQYAGKPESPEQKLALQNIYQIVDRMIDAYARAIALAGTDPKHQQNKTLWTQNLTDWYKFRNNNSDAGMNELVSGILAKPLPDIPTPLTTLPTPPATGATTGGSATPTPSGAAPPAPPKPATTGTPTQPAKTTTAPKTPPNTTSTTKPKPKANHRRRG